MNAILTIGAVTIVILVAMIIYNNHTQKKTNTQN